MGKQSSRIYYKEKEHYDVLYSGAVGLVQRNCGNHAKMYLGSELLWEREKPKYLLKGFGRFGTSENLKTFSEFENVSLKGLGGHGGWVFFLKNKFWMIDDFSTTRPLYYSDDGYFWNVFNIPESLKGEQFCYGTTIYSDESKNDIVGVIITKKKVIYLEVDNYGNFQLQAKYELPPGSVGSISSFLNSGKYILVVSSDYCTLISGCKKPKTAQKLGSGAYAIGAESNCFFRAMSGTISKSTDGINWEYYCQAANDGGAIAEVGEYIYQWTSSSKNLVISRKKPRADWESHTILKDDEDIYIPQLVNIIEDFFFVHIHSNNKIYRTKDLFSINSTNEFAQNGKVEIVKTTYSDKFPWRIESICKNDNTPFLIQF